MDISFHPAGSSERGIIQDLSRRIWQFHYPGIISQAQIDYMLERMYSSAALQTEMEQQGYRYVLVHDHGTPIGFLSFRHEPADNAVLLSKIYLLPDYHGRGVGQQMLRYARNEAAVLGASSLSLFVNRNNVRAIRAYRRFGFRHVKDIVTDIGCGFVMDDHLMACRV